MTYRFVSVVALLLATIVAGACSRQEPPSAPTAQPTASFDLPAMRRMIEEKNGRFTKAHISGDSATIDAMFTRDARSFPPGGEAVSGAAALHQFTVEYINAGVTEFREETTAFYGNEDLLVDEGTYVVGYGPGGVLERGKYLNVWKPEDGTWKIDANIWNTSAPPAATK